MANRLPIVPAPFGFFPDVNTETSLYSADFAYRSSLMFVGERPTGPDQSDAEAGTTTVGDDTIRSGLPSVHAVTSPKSTAGGRSFGSPSGAPLSAHFAILPSSSSVRDTSSLNC